MGMARLLPGLNEGVDVTDSAATQPPGWYHAQGDPPGTQRYWDGAQWVGGPQAAQDGGSVEPAASGGGFAQPAFSGGGTGGTAAFGTRAVALIIDAAIVIGIFVAVLILGVLVAFISNSLGWIVWILGYIGALVFSLWNAVVRQGKTGQTIGKEKQNIKLISEEHGGPVGIGPAFIRGLLGGLINSVCYIDFLWPLFDEQKKRLSDKILNTNVVDA